MELRIVVSEMGEQWSPQVAPARTDEMAPSRRVWAAAGSIPLSLATSVASPIASTTRNRLIGGAPTMSSSCTAQPQPQAGQRGQERGLAEAAVALWAFPTGQLEKTRPRLSQQADPVQSRGMETVTRMADQERRFVLALVIGNIDHSVLIYRLD